MSDTCPRCGRKMGISFNDIDAYKKCLGGAPCLERAYERSQAALAVARRECDALIAVPIDGQPPEKVRRLTGRLAALFTAPGKMCVAYAGREHVYVRYGRDQWARVKRSRK